MNKDYTNIERIPCFQPYHPETTMTNKTLSTAINNRFTKYFEQLEARAEGDVTLLRLMRMPHVKEEFERLIKNTKAFKKQMNTDSPIQSIAVQVHEAWRKQNDPIYAKQYKPGQKIIEKNSEGVEVDINVHFYLLPQEKQEEYIAATKVALYAMSVDYQDSQKPTIKSRVEIAAEYVHNEWQKHHQKKEDNAIQHVPYADLPEEEKSKVQGQVLMISNILHRGEYPDWSGTHVRANLETGELKIYEKYIPPGNNNAVRENYFGENPHEVIEELLGMSFSEEEKAFASKTMMPVKTEDLKNKSINPPSDESTFGM